ncbi:glycosyltransferase [Nocardioides jiangxiensis]|uniref:Glycosyltransferase n=1 Tax=Nocardioides jiangxiensis TaxID=3064524 RepID=A0ABT9AZ45_9ACTN|nr:glycosyltransferase [Nocardioides sp. WY-20]MDO7867861.1 glycosyltransferase [Nocardioides sp. WY-20]
MHVVIDALVVKAGSSAVILENLLQGWREVAPEDRLTVLVSGAPAFAVPDGVELHQLTPPRGGTAGSAWLRTTGPRRAARRLGADLFLCGVVAAALAGTGSTPRGVILTDLRHELRPEQFSARRRAARRASYALSFRLADGIYTISERTRDDVVRLHPSTRGKAIPARLGSDHVDRWPTPSGPAASAGLYALAFGHFANKNVDAVLAAWAEFCTTDALWTLRLIGMGRADREAATRKVAELGIADRVELMPWLDDDAFAECFSGAGLVVFPSDFEGFGLPPIEAQRLGIPVVISADPALREVTGGLAEVATSIEPGPLADRIRAAIAATPEQLAAARLHTDDFTWAGMARTIREDLAARR